MSPVLIEGDNRDHMGQLPMSDSIVTDPPYGLGFMESAWDASVPGLEYWQLALQAVKPGGYLAAFGHPRTFHRLMVAIEDSGFELRDTLCWLYGGGFPKSKNLGNGRGTALKPAWEPIVLARRPLVGSNGNNAAAYGGGGLSIDACRIEALDEDYARNCSGDRGHEDNRNRQLAFTQTAGHANDLGRWPANVLLDEEAAQVLDAQTGGGSRFFYCAKASRKERNMGCEDLEPLPLQWSSGPKKPGTFQSEGTDKASPNNWPTVKPIALMRWLVRLVTPPGGTVLDPFMGSGSTGMACVYEGLGFVGIENDEHAMRIARHRVAAVLALETSHA